MDNIRCEICRDLLPLVLDGVASDHSRQAVEQHTTVCPHCRALLAGAAIPAADSGRLLKKLRQKWFRLTALALLLVVCLVLSVAAVTQLLDARTDERRYMANLYGDLKELHRTAAILTEATPEDAATTEAVIYLCCCLDAVDDALLDGQQYVSPAIPGVCAWWFGASAAKLRSSLSDQGRITADTIQQARELASDMEYLLEQMTGPDGMNLDPDMTIEAFSSILLTFYQNS